MERILKAAAWTLAGACLFLATAAPCMAAASQAEASPDSDAPCPPAIDVTTIVSTAEGLEIKSVAPIAPRIVSTEIYTPVGGAQFSLLVLEIPNVRLAGPAARLEWEAGAFSSARIVRYRNASECGLRLRLQPRAAANWILQPKPDGVIVTARGLLEARAAAESAASAATESTTAKEPGAATVSATGAWNRYDEGTEFNGVLQAGLAQALHNIGTLKVFAASLNPKEKSGSPYGAIGLFGVRAGRVVVDVAAGDLFASYGDAGLSEGSYVNNLLIRGGGASVLLGRNVQVQGFSGRAGVPSLFRLRTGTVGSEISDDRVHGIQASWTGDSRTLGFGLGYTLSDPIDGPSHDNFIQSFIFRSREAYSALLALEESRAGDASGYAITAEPEVNTTRTHANGFYRYMSREFTPPLGSSYYATLRHSYGLSLSQQFSDDTTANASLSQTKSFNPFDPVEVGTLSSFASVGVTQRLWRRMILTASVNGNEFKSEEGAVLPSDSRTTAEQVGIGYAREFVSASVRAGHEQTENFIDPHDGLRTVFLDGDVNRSFGHDYDGYVRWRWAHAERPSGAHAGPDFSIDAALHTTRWATVDLRGEVGVAERPSGVAAQNFRDVHATIGVRSGPAFRNRRAGISFTYRRLEVGNEPGREVFMALIDVGALANWGNRARDVVPPFETRALSISQTRRTESEHRGDVRVTVFADENRNGIRDVGEALLPAIDLVIDDRSYVTDPTGSTIASVLPGSVKLQLITTGGATEFYVPVRRKTVVAKEDAIVEADFALVPAGHVAGVLRVEDVEGRSVSFYGVSIVAQNARDRFETIADRRGEFRFGQLPAGTYSIHIDRSSLPSAYVVEGEENLTVEVKAGSRQQIAFTLRKATTRERLGIPGGGSGRNRNRG